MKAVGGFLDVKVLIPDNRFNATKTKWNPLVCSQNHYVIQSRHTIYAAKTSESER